MARTVRILRLWLATTFRAAPLLMGLACLLVAVRATTAPVQTYGVKLFVDGLTGVDPSGIGWGVGVIMAGFAVTFAGIVVTGPLQDTAQERMAGRVHADLLRVTTGVPAIAHHERPDIADKLEMIREHSWRLGVGAEVLLWSVAALVNTVTVLVLLASVHPFLLVLPLLGAARIWSAYVAGRAEQAAWDRTAPEGRLIDRLIEIAKAPRHALELRVFGLGPVLVDRLRGLLGVRFEARTRAARWALRVDGVVRLGFGIATALAILWVIWLARQGSATTGDVVLVILMAPQVDQMTGSIAGNFYWVGELARNFARYDWLRQYADDNSWADSRSPAPDRLASGIELRDVEFSYPGSERPVLADVNLHLPAGRTIALVGENGAGKTTLVKLLTRLYDPTGGAVLVDGQDLRDLDPEAWRSRTSAGFQDFVKFEFTAREAVGIGDHERLHDPEAIWTAVERGDAEAVVAGLPDGLDTQLGKRFGDGVELSGGQWQRLALARAFMRPRPLLLLLDEPAAALDPEAEHVLFERFAAASKAAAGQTGGITVLVSHRFSTVRMADLIVVLQHGRIIEVGEHADLVAAGGRYAELFAMQARAYR
jgi:ATP-binding cassette, subfamily B, bacterial